MDGKSFCGSHNTSEWRSVIHIMNAFATAQGICLGRSNVGSKTNEITEIPKLLDLLNISDRLVAIDGMDCQKKIAQKVMNKNAKYLFAVNGN